MHAMTQRHSNVSFMAPHIYIIITFIIIIIIITFIIIGGRCDLTLPCSSSRGHKVTNRHPLGVAPPDLSEAFDWMSRVCAQVEMRVNWL
ncbi:hypothetical protein INR49_002814 [Caranx melampygus]|nr:hypothetical protein INR49_002832 [Caranx melampygus]KAG7235289.1 hypothetical protein INR49_002814 [Caranx melampygus]